MRRSHADLMLLFCAIIWGTAFAFQKTATAHLGAAQFAACRGAVAALALLPFVIWELRRQQASIEVARGSLAGLAWQVGLAGVLFCGGAVLHQQGLMTTTVTNAGFLTALYVVIVPILAWVLRSESPSPAVWGAVAVSFLGAWLMTGGGLAALSGGDLLVVASAFFWAAHVVSLSLPAARARPVTFTMLQFCVVAILGLAASLTTGGIPLEGVRAAAREIMFVGILSSAVTFALFTIAVRSTSPSEAAVIVSSEVVFAALVGHYWFADRLALSGWIGAFMIMGATLAISFFGRRQATTSAP